MEKTRMSRIFIVFAIAVPLVLGPFYLTGASATPRDRDDVYAEYLVNTYCKRFLPTVNLRLAFRSMLYIESKNGKYKSGMKDHSFGIAQVKVDTVMDMAPRWNIKIPETTEAIISMLYNEDDFGAKIGAAYFKTLYDQEREYLRQTGEINDDKALRLAIIAYNRGFEGAKLKESQKDGLAYWEKVNRKYKGFKSEYDKTHKQQKKSAPKRSAWQKPSNKRKITTLTEYKKPGITAPQVKPEPQANQNYPAPQKDLGSAKASEPLGSAVQSKN